MQLAKFLKTYLVCSVLHSLKGYTVFTKISLRCQWGSEGKRMVVPELTVAMESDEVSHSHTELTADHVFHMTRGGRKACGVMPRQN